MSDAALDLFKVLQESVLDLAGKVAVLENEVSALSAINLILAIRICELEDQEAGRTLSLLDIMGLHKKITLPEMEVGSIVRQFRRTLSAMLDTDDPVSPLLLGILQAKDAGPERLAALRSWQSQATDDELAGDVLELFRRLFHQSGDENPQSPDDPPRS